MQVKINTVPKFSIIQTPDGRVGYLGRRREYIFASDGSSTPLLDEGFCTVIHDAEALAIQWMQQYDSKLAAFRSGWDAWIEGVPMSRNPHTTHSIHWIEWRRGFTEAREAEIAKQHDPGPVQLAFDVLSPENSVQRQADQTIWTCENCGQSWQGYHARTLCCDNPKPVRFSQENQDLPAIKSNPTHRCILCGQPAWNRDDMLDHLWSKHNTSGCEGLNFVVLHEQPKPKHPSEAYKLGREDVDSGEDPYANPYQYSDKQRWEDWARGYRDRWEELNGMG